MDPIKQAFELVKDDISYLCQELEEIKRTLLDIKTEIKQQTTHRQQTTDTSTLNLPLEPVKSQDIAFSNGNRGVSTDRQTNQQTDRQPLDFVQKTPEIASN